MSVPQDAKPSLFDAFLKSAQYLARLKSQQDVWDHLAKLIVTHFPAAWTAFARRDSARRIALHHSTLPRGLAAYSVLTKEVRTVIGEVIESGFLAWHVIDLPTPSMTVLLPIVEEQEVKEVMLIGHRDAEPLAKELLDVYLAVAGLAGTALERLHSEVELKRHRARLHELVKERTAALSQAQRQNELILASAREGICGVDLAGRITFVNPFAAQLVGWEAAELIGRGVHATFHHTRPDGRDCPADECLVLTTLKDGAAREATGEEFCRKDGTRFPVELRTAPIVEDGKLVGTVIVFQDITVRKEAEEALQRTADELARSNQDLEQFAYVASHDLQEPLRMVAGYLQLLSERYRGRLDEKADKFIDYAVDGAERMSGLIRDLLSYARLNTRAGQLRGIRVEEALGDALRNLHSAIQESGAAISHDPLPEVRADQTQLAQLFQNLVGNAIKFRCPERAPQIHVSARRDDGQWLFTVQDNGIGFDPQYQDKMFLIFQRLHSRGKYPGTGIGLAICKRIVERHGGTIWASGKPDQGAAFSFTIPIPGTS